MTLETKEVLKVKIDEMKKYCDNILEPKVTYDPDRIKMLNEVIKVCRANAREIRDILNLVR